MADKYIIHLAGGAPLHVGDDLRITAGVGVADIGARLIGFVNPVGQRDMITAAKAMDDPDSIIGWEPSIGSRGQIFGWGFLVDSVETIVATIETEGAGS